MPPTTEDNFYVMLVITDEDHQPVIQSEVQVTSNYDSTGLFSFEQALTLSKELREHAARMSLDDLK